MTDTKELNVREKQEVASPAEQTKPGPVYQPAVDIFETERDITLLADMPGVDQQHGQLFVGLGIGSLADDLGIGPGIRRARRLVRKRRQVLEPAGLLQLAAIVEVFGHRNDITGTALVDEAIDGLEDEAMVLAVEVRGRDDVRDPVPGLRIEHQAPDEGPFRFYGVGRHLEALLGTSVNHPVVQRSDH